MCDVAVAVDGRVGSGEPTAVDDRGVVQLVGVDHRVGGDAASAPRTPRLACVAAGEQRAPRSRPTHAARAASSSSWTGRAADDQSRRAGAGTVTLERCAGGCHDRRVLAEPQIVVGRERHDGPAVRGDRGGGAARLDGADGATPAEAGDLVVVSGDPVAPAVLHLDHDVPAASTSAMDSASVSTMRSISVSVLVRMGMTTTTSPSGRSSTPRRTRRSTDPAAPSVKPLPSRELDADHQSRAGAPRRPTPAGRRARRAPGPAARRGRGRCRAPPTRRRAGGARRPTAAARAFPL